MTQLLESKNAIIYGAGGSLGGAVARTFAREGAAVFLAGRHAEPLKAVAADVTAAGGTAEVAVVDALDEEAVAAHAADVVARRGTLDVSFNLITRGDVQGIPFLDLATADLLAPVATGLATNFVTARAAARHMVPQGSGVILSLTSASSIGTAPAMGGTGPADAAIEALMRYLAAEWGPSGVRVVGLWTAGVVESLTDEKIGAVAGPGAPSAAQVREMLAQAATLRRSPRLEDVAETALFLASDRAAAVTASIVNVTCGLVIPA
jgi:NAD(P)-dependent dehydrogenase (short-subunit alcohol dehydrogenase family)